MSLLIIFFKLQQNDKHIMYVQFTKFNGFKSKLLFKCLLLKLESSYYGL